MNDIQKEILPIEEIETTTITTPGTVLLKEVQHDSKGSIILVPMPTSDPNDPLNWSKWRKAVNFGLASFFVFFTLVVINIIYIPFATLKEQYDFTYRDFTTAAALCFVGQATGSVLFLPLLHRYGRRPLYLLGLSFQFVASMWLSEMNSSGELVGAYFFSGLGGGLSETLLQVTIVDLYFVHQRATMSALFLMVQAAGSCLGPLAAGYIDLSQGWRWIWRWCGILLGVNLILVCFLFEESKYTMSTRGQPTQVAQAPGTTKFECPVENHRPTLDPHIKRKTYWQRMAPITKTDAPVKQHIYSPFIVLLTFPAVTYAAFTYGALITWYGSLISLVDSTIVYAPYDFSPSGVGLITLSIGIGCAFGTIVGGPVNDYSVVWLSGKNKGVYEPETRLYLALAAIIPVIAGILMVGLGLAHNVHWAVLAVGYGIFGFGWVVIGDCALAYVTDCYQDLVGDALVAVVFVRNALSIAVQFGLSAWLKAVGLENLIISIACIAFAFMLLPVPLIIWGKKARGKTAEKYREMVRRMPSHRPS